MIEGRGEAAGAFANDDAGDLSSAIVGTGGVVRATVSAGGVAVSCGLAAIGGPATVG